MRRTTTRYLAALIAAAVLTAGAKSMAYEAAFDKTPDGEIAVRELPPARLLSTTLDGSYFDRSSALFRRLFDYISSNGVAMTVPVEGDLGEAQMRFYLGEDAPAGLADTPEVRIGSTPRRQVASIGARGAYSAGNVAKARERLESWLDGQDRWRIAGEPYAVFWNGPFTPWFLKHFEVHVPVTPAGGD